MKKRISFKILTIALALVICLVPMLTVIANARPAESVPTIYIHGLMASTVYADPDDPDSESCWPPSNDSIIQTVKDSLPLIAKLVATKDWESFGDGICKEVYEMFEPIICNSDGTANGKTGVRFSYPRRSEINSGSILTFRYDWRLDPVKVAADLDKFIDYVLDCSGSETVKICCHSLGGVITDTYLTLYGNSKVSAVCFNSTAIFGQTYIGELMAGQIVLDADAVQWFLSYLFDYMEYKNILNTVVDMVKEAGLLDAVVNLGNALIAKLLEQVSIEVLAPMFGRWLSVWAMTADKDIEAAEKNMFNYFDSNDEGYDILKTKIDYFNENVRPFKEQTLKALNEKANVYVISRYGYCSIPITPSFNINSDGVIDTANTSFGATVSLFGEKLTDEQLAGVDEKYISPDKTVDASTCMFPEQTWFIKDMQHSSNSGSLNNLMYSLLAYDGQATVDTFEGYQRFNRYDPYTEAILPDNREDTKVTFMDRIILFMQEFIKLMKSLFSKITVK